MALHPSASWSFDDLSRELEDRVLRGMVRVTTAHDAPHLRLYVYKKSTEHDRSWDHITTMARGITLDYRARVIRSRPFPKFFNYGEVTYTIPDGPVSFFDKPDGSLGIVFRDGDRWRITTKGGFTSPQSQWAESWMRANVNLDALRMGDTYLTEIVYLADRKVVRYDFEGMILLGVYAADGRGYTRAEVEDAARLAGLRVVEALTFDSFASMMAAVATFDRDREGCVAHWPDTDYRVKVKGAEYLRVMRVISRVTPLAVWEAMLAGVRLDDLRREVPEEFWGDFDAIAAALRRQLTDLIGTIDRECARVADKTNREVAAMLDTFDPRARRFVLARRKKGDGMVTDKQARAALFDAIRPTGNVLAGYTPSESLQRAAGGE
jgi:RNA ligase